MSESGNEKSRRQDEINESEWRHAANWRGPDWMAVYSSKIDSRVWVPKRLKWMGWTLNFGRPAGRSWLIAIIVAIVLLFLTIGILIKVSELSISV